MEARCTTPLAHETANANDLMKKKPTATMGKPATPPHLVHSIRPKRSLMSRLWAEVHPKPSPPIGHPIPPLTPTPVEAQHARFRLQTPKGRRPAALDLLARLLAPLLALTLLTTGCAATRPLKGGKAVTTRKPAGVVEQTLVQGENASQPTRQDQEIVKVRTYTVPAGSRVEQAQTPDAAPAQPPSRSSAGQQKTINSQPSPAFVLSAPMPVIEREETRARSELGAAQKDTARELGAKLSSLKGIVWVGAGLFVFGLASLVWPPLKAVIASVTTSAALMLGGAALMVLPTLVVGNELLILGGVALAVGAWFLAHRHGQLRGLLAANPPSQTPATPPSAS